MNAMQRYMEQAVALLASAAKAQAEPMEQAAALIADALAAGGYVFTFGTGHSHLLAEEIFYRAGGLVRVYPILEDALMLHRAAARSSQLERMSGLAEPLLDDIDVLRCGGVMLLFSNSGCNTVAVDMALQARARGLKTVCITNLTHAARSTSRHPDGKKLCEVCDVVIDNMGCYGDAAISVGEHVTGPTSTVVGAALLQAVVCRAVELLGERNAPVEIFHSANTAGGDEANAALIEKYKPFVKAL